MALKEFVTKNNVKTFFADKRISTSQLRVGMICSFQYRSPDRKIHDPTPLIYVLEIEKDRVWGLNLHYDFRMIGDIIADKRIQIYDATGYQKEGQKLDQQGRTGVVGSHRDKVVGSNNTPNPNVVGSGAAKPNRNVVGSGAAKPSANVVGGDQHHKIPAEMLEIFHLDQHPKAILRNYLMQRVSSLSKMVYKP